VTSYIWHLSSLRTAIVKVISGDPLGAIGLALIRHGGGRSRIAGQRQICKLQVGFPADSKRCDALGIALVRPVACFALSRVERSSSHLQGLVLLVGTR